MICLGAVLYYYTNMYTSIWIELRCYTWKATAPCERTLRND